MERKMIYGAMIEIMRQVQTIKKEKRNEAQKFMFRGIDDMMNSLHRIFADNGVFITTEVLEYDVVDRPTKNGGVNYFTHAKIRFNFIAEDGSWVPIVTVGEAMDSGDKGMNKAMSIALKYALMQAFLIPTEDIADPDAETPDESLDTGEQQALADIEACATEAELLQVWQKWASRYGRQGSEFYQKWAIKRSFLRNGNAE